MEGARTSRTGSISGASPMGLYNKGPFTSWPKLGGKLTCDGPSGVHPASQSSCCTIDKIQLLAFAALRSPSVPFLPSCLPALPPLIQGWNPVESNRCSTPPLPACAPFATPRARCSLPARGP